MNFSNILNEIQRVDPEVFEKTSERRHILKNFGSKVALAAVPFALGSLFQKAYGKSTDAIVDILNFALTLEYLESKFYATATATTGLILPADQPGFNNIASHEAEHVAFLKDTIISMNGTPVAEPTFDFTAGGTFPDVFLVYSTFLAVSQTFEDTGVRAYKGQAGGLQTNHDVLTAALQIHSVEARHASHVRYVRMMMGAAVKPWITGNQSGINSSAVQASYNGEDNKLQGSTGLDITTLPGANGNISLNTATEAFDEPLTQAQVLAIVGPFIKP